MNLEGTFFGCLLGAAVGDAIGAAVSGCEYACSSTSVEPGARIPCVAHAGATTSRTQMTLFTSEGLIRAAVRAETKGICSPPAVVEHAYLRWLLTQGGTSTHDLFSTTPDGWLVAERRLWRRQMPDATCLESLSHPDLHDHGFARNDGSGCGALTRVAPVGLLLGPAGHDSDGHPAYDMALQTAALTHGHVNGYLAAAYFAEVVSQLRSGRPLRHAIQQALRPLEAHHYADWVLMAVDKAVRLAALGEEPPHEKVAELTGGVAAHDCLAVALYCALVARSFVHGVELAVVFGGDRASVGALTGTLLGLTNGVGALPASWLERLELRDLVEGIARDLVSVARGEPLDTDAWWQKYPGW